jgi:hypothetical protein
MAECRDDRVDHGHDGDGDGDGDDTVILLLLLMMLSGIVFRLVFHTVRVLM